MKAKLSARGISAKYAAKISNRFLKWMLEDNPAILAVLRDRDLFPYRNLLGWTGEFAGKYITGAYYTWRLTGDEELKDYIAGFLGKLLACQDEDGYLGCFSKETRFTGALPQTPDVRPYTWDLWAHYHIAYGLLLWDSELPCGCFAAAEKIAGLIARTFYHGKDRIADVGSLEMNLAVYHLFAILYEKTGKREYLTAIGEMEKDMEDGQAGDWLRLALAGEPYYKSRKPRWEALHALMGWAPLYRATGDEKYLAALKQSVESILAFDVHNTGGFSTREQAIGTPFMSGPIETCCVVAFDALMAELYELTGDVRLIDALERAQYNAVLGSVSPSGAWCTYDTPMDGERFASYHYNDFQSRPGSPLLNCCSVNYARGVSEIVRWMLAERDGALYLNALEPFEASFEGGTIRVEGDYPYSPEVKIVVNTDKKVYVRIPSYSGACELTVNGNKTVISPGYFLLPSSGEFLLKFDFTPYYLVGAGEFEGLVSVYKGPLLFAYDISKNPRFSHLSGHSGIETADRLKELVLPPVTKEELGGAALRKGADGSLELVLPSGVVLVDFAHAGMDGALYKSWLNIQNERRIP